MNTLSRRRMRLGCSVAIALLASLAMAGCGGEPGTLPVVDPKIPPIRLTSTAFADGQLIPADYTCDGKSLSPPLSWTDVPPTARSLVLLCDDPDAPLRTCPPGSSSTSRQASPDSGTESPTSNP